MFSLYLTFFQIKPRYAYYITNNDVAEVTYLQSALIFRHLAGHQHEVACMPPSPFLGTILYIQFG